MMIDGNVGNTEANVPLKKDCSLYHTGLKKGDVSNLIMIVGDPSRALLASKLLSNTKIINGRNYTTYSGEYSGKIVSIVSIGMVFNEIQYILGICKCGLFYKGSMSNKSQR